MTATSSPCRRSSRRTSGIPSEAHWKVYLGVFLASIAGTVPLVLKTERSGGAGVLFVLAVALTGVSQSLLGFDHAHLWTVLAALVLFFAVFNYLEARLPRC